MIAWFTRNGVAANLLMIGILLIGSWTAITQIPLEVFPSSDIETVKHFDHLSRGDTR